MCIINMHVREREGGGGARRGLGLQLGDENGFKFTAVTKISVSINFC